MSNFPAILETKRFIMRQRAPRDLKDLLDLDDDPDVIRYVGDIEVRANRKIYWEQCFEYPNQSPIYVIRDRTNGAFRGWVFLRPFHDDSGDWELGYRLKKSAWGHGIATEAARTLLEWGWLQPQIKIVVGGYEAANTASLNVMLKLGMKQVGMRHYVGEGFFPSCAMSRPL